MLDMEFMRHALLAGVLASVALGIIGALVVVNRVVFVSGGIAHAAYGGVGLAIFLGVAPVLGAAAFTLAVALVMAAITMRRQERTDAVIGVIWAVGMALGVIMVDLAPGYQVDLMSYLFGSILAVPAGDLWFMAALDLLTLVLLAVFHRQLAAMSFDEEFARTRGVPVTVLRAGLMAFIALAVVLIMRVVGLILVIALMTIPCHIVEGRCRSLMSMMAASVVLNAVFSLLGLWLSFRFDLASGPSIIMVAGAAFFVVAAWDRLRARSGG